jgi:hypothetical protein
MSSYLPPKCRPHWQAFCRWLLRRTSSCTTATSAARRGVLDSAKANAPSDGIRQLSPTTLSSTLSEHTMTRAPGSYALPQSPFGPLTRFACLLSAGLRTACARYWRGDLLDAITILTVGTMYAMLGWKELSSGCYSMTPSAALYQRGLLKTSCSASRC